MKRLIKTTRVPVLPIQLNSHHLAAVYEESKHQLDALMKLHRLVVAISVRARRDNSVITKAAQVLFYTMQNLYQ